MIITYRTEINGGDLFELLELITVEFFKNYHYRFQRNDDEINYFPIRLTIEGKEPIVAHVTKDQLIELGGKI